MPRNTVLAQLDFLGTTGVAPEGTSQQASVDAPSLETCRTNLRQRRDPVAKGHSIPSQECEDQRRRFHTYLQRKNFGAGSSRPNNNIQRHKTPLPLSLIFEVIFALCIATPGEPKTLKLLSLANRSRIVFRIRQHISVCASICAIAISAPSHFSS